MTVERWPRAPLTVPLLVLLVHGSCAREAVTTSAQTAAPFVNAAEAQRIPPSSARLAALPDGEERRRFILDCTGCHTLRDDIARPGGQPRTEESWRVATASMVARFGAASSFPVIGPDRDAAATAAWLARSLPAEPAAERPVPAHALARADFREYLIPEPNDLPHDVAVDGDRIVITGMFTGRMYVLDPASGVFGIEPTPAPNPRAVEIDTHGNWWVVLGGPNLLARRSPAGEWTTFDTGFYAHSVALDSAGNAWANGHFTHEPELVRRIDPRTRAHRDFTVPSHPGFATTTVPYEIRTAPDGAIWMTELHGNRIVRIAADGNARAWNLPTSWSGPRRHDIDRDGVLWIPLYGAGSLARFDPATERFDEIPLPIDAAAPYIARYDNDRGVIWIGTGAADAVLSYDPAARRFRVYRLPASDQLIRHMAIDEATGDIWLAPGSSPGSVPARVVRMRPID